ncbi:cytochrome c oxidase accessory protein CcoG [Sphingomonas sp. S1-29]|uniref:Cytochrome c oxidase accessory protein CcoG n=1 Tax=Sphingomonas qomolangmaensis TaxID=2918765 RepID=A0ABY5LDX4_9SPHN|nr:MULTISPECIES: cytochrome c oxidase accessory protein CcoG [Sphingomonas]UUL84045.1 cytochrome c oxidase accessory protein CcoG [Sphingomonas qomolangmaensis]UZK70571.1 cytochrome c oxidase accessory protein CcoG [Sphingomonas sp. S1-29]
MIFPKAVDGAFRRFKWVVMIVTLAIYYITPWLRWDRGPYAPDQAVLIDLANRRFYMFAIEIWPHEFYYVAGLLVMAAIGLFFVTSAVGRAWCGYACPQTVWTDLFQHVERWIDGDRNAQIRLQRAPWSLGKIARRVAKHSVWIAIGVLTGGAWIFYFADAPTLAPALFSGEAPMVAYSTVALLTATTYVLGGLMREQVCQFMCPWPRIQAAMMDEQSLTVTYKEWRGEPRSHGLKRAQADAADGPDPLRIGDCIDCNACVAVCPTGIDIRGGPQIGCITCGLCIDACDDAMLRVGREPKLIGYSTQADDDAARAGKPSVAPLRRMLRPRTLIYLGSWSAIGAVMLFALETRSHLDISVTQTRNPQWVQLSDGSIRNTYTVKIRNMETRPRRVEIAIDGEPALLWDERGSRETAGRAVQLAIDPDQVTKTQLFVAAPGDGPQHSDLRFTVRALDGDHASASDDSRFERPEETQ